ncbi:MAG: hypothetical protein FJ137_05535 [Deltaproteobacteria bacterium]|nr:hypothetical protein [Planctomycetota bacterium]MBM4280224.1 hypothetical protein [Deltaproteobacteria bacterium]
MSALWHDPDFHPVKRFETPVVGKNYEELPLPAEQVELPDGVADPFSKLDAVYDAAAAQMDRGLKGAEFLHGKKIPALSSSSAIAETPASSPSPLSARVAADDPTRLVERQRAVDAAAPQRHERVHQPVHQTMATTLQRQEREHHRALDAAAGAYQPGATSPSTKTAGAAEAERAARQGAIDSAASMAATFAPMAAAQVVTTVAQGPLPALAAQAAQAVEVAGAVASAGELALVGFSEGLKDTAPTGDDGAPRRGLRRR